MQGVIYTILADMMIESQGMGFWNQLLSDLELPSNGIYTAGIQYKDEELLQIVGYLTKKLNISEIELVRSYGRFLFPRLLKRLPSGYVELSSLKRFLLQVDEVIHKEVKRIHPDVYLPEFSYEDPGANELVMIYRSRRKLCSLSEGLIYGAGEYFKTPVQIKHPKCMLRGDDHCRLELTIG